MKHASLFFAALLLGPFAVGACGGNGSNLFGSTTGSSGQGGATGTGSHASTSTSATTASGTTTSATTASGNPASTTTGTNAAGGGGSGAGSGGAGGLATSTSTATTTGTTGAATTATTTTGSGMTVEVPCGNAGLCNATPDSSCCWTGLGGGCGTGECVQGAPGADGCNTQGGPGASVRILCSLPSDCGGLICCGSRYNVGGSLYYSQIDCEAQCGGSNVTLCDVNNPICPMFDTANGPMMGVCQPSTILPAGYYVCNAPS
jgi:hypothetical protein